MSQEADDDQRLVTDAVIRMLEERRDQLNDISRIGFGADPLITGARLVSESGREYLLLIQPLLPLSDPSLAPPQALAQQEVSFLQEQAEFLADHASGEDMSLPVSDYWDVWDGMRSSVGQEYVLAPDRAGWHVLRGSRVLEVSIRYADPETAHQVRMEQDESYALAHAEFEEEATRADAVINIDDDLDDEYSQPEMFTGLNGEPDYDSVAAEIPAACDISGDQLVTDK